MPLILRTHGNRFNCPREHQLRNSYYYTRRMRRHGWK